MHKLTLGQVAKPVQQIRHPQRHRGLAGAWRPGKAHVQIRPRGGDAELVPGPVNELQRCDLLDLVLDRHKPDEVVVERRQKAIDIGILALCVEADGGVRRKHVPAAFLRPRRDFGRDRSGRADLAAAGRTCPAAEP